MNDGVTLFTGIPGIGKSLFLVYFIYRFLHDDRFEDEKFALEFTSNEYVTFEPTADSGKFVCSSLNGHQMYGKDFPVFCDISASALEQPASRKGWLLIFSGLDPLRSKEMEMIKDSPTYTSAMPTWSGLELKMMMVGNSFCFKYLVLYGVPKPLMSRDNIINPHSLSHCHSTSSVKAPTKRKRSDCDSGSDSGGTTGEWIGWYSFGMDDELQRCFLVHAEPPASNYGGWSDDKAATANSSDIDFSSTKIKPHAKMQGRWIPDASY